jgi:hypothetical protein
LSVAEAVSFWNAVNEELCVITGKPHDIGTSDAHAGSTVSPATMLTRTAMIIHFFIVLPSSILTGY